jgi:hypothetical protein
MTSFATWSLLEHDLQFQLVTGLRQSILVNYNFFAPAYRRQGSASLREEKEYVSQRS